MAEELRVDTDKLYKAGSGLNYIGERIVSLFRRFEGETAAYDGCMGNDKHGKLIAEEYLASKESIAKAGSSRGNVAQEFGTGLMDGAAAELAKTVKQPPSPQPGHGRPVTMMTAGETTFPTVRR
jgi:hypothetical protein